MREIPAALAAHLATGATTMCHCWRVTAKSGEVLGFTDHDRDLTFDGVTHEAATGFTASEAESSLGFSINNHDVAGALSSGRLTEERIGTGDFDGAAVEAWWVNWQDVSQRLLMRKGSIGEITRGALHFQAEFRGLTAAFDQPRGRLYQFGCDAVLGDARCTVDLANVLYRAQSTVTAVEGNGRFVVSGLSSFDDGWFSRGTITWTSGANALRRSEIKSHRKANGLVAIELWQQETRPIAIGDAFEARAGCDKQFSTCRAKFSNGLNFRGFPQIPGEDFVLSYPRRGDPKNDGDSWN